MLVASIFITQASAQSYYPGGLGNANLMVWLNANKATSITQNGSNQVSQWSDLSGNSYNFGQATTANKPVYSSTAGPNSRPAMTFNATNSQYFSSLANLPVSISFTSGISSFAVANFSAPLTVQGWQRIYDFGNGQGSNNFMMGRNANTANLYYEGWNGGTGDQTYTTTASIVNGTANLFEAVQQAGAAGNLTNVSHYVAGTSQANSGAAGSSKTWITNSIARTNNYIGRSNWAADNYFGGAISEILIYTTAFNTTQRVILENYTSAEWGQTISTSEYTTPTATTYGTNLVGIGYTSTTDQFLADLAGSTDGLGFSSTNTAAGFLNTAGYLMAAHNGQANTVISNASVPGITSASSLTLWNRSWNVQKTGGNASGAITLNFNFSDYNGSTPSGTATYALLYNATDGSFASGTNTLVTTTSTSVSGNIVSFTASATNLANGYYSILYSASPILLPVVLTNFEASRQGNNSLLSWSVSDALGLTLFDIERSTDGVTYTTIGSLTATAYDAAPGSYTFTDNKPATGVNYYRLKIADQDGKISYSGIRSVDYAAGSVASLSIYPNPTTDMLHIVVSNTSGTTDVRVVNMQGAVVRSIPSASASTIDIPVNDLATGMYVIEIRNGSTKVVRKIMKK